MKKLLSLVLATIMVVGLTACNTTPTSTETPTPSVGAEDPTKAPDVGNTDDGKYELALVTDVGTIDDKSFNQGAWEGIVQYAEEKSVSHQYYQPADQSDESLINAIELAIAGGAKVIVCPGFLFEVAVFEMQNKYPEMNFIMLDSAPRNPDTDEYETASNTVAVYYAEEEAGYLAGYAAVTEGYRKLGFMGGIAVPPVVRFGYGYIQGAEHAAKDLGLAADEVSVKYHYVGNFDASPENMAVAAAWYNEGIEVIFGCGGGVGNSVMKAAETSGKKVIGVDVDQSSESETVITSSMKNLQKSVYDSITDYYAGNFKGGQNLTLNAKVEGVQLPMETSRFTVFNKAKYDEIYKTLVDGSVTLVRDDIGEKATDVPVELVKVELVN